jgi:hypothetical protein
MNSNQNADARLEVLEPVAERLGSLATRSGLDHNLRLELHELHGELQRALGTIRAAHQEEVRGVQDLLSNVDELRDRIGGLQV